MENLPQEILSRLDALAAKMGTTIEYLWPIIIQQQYNKGIILLCLSILLGILFGIGLYSSKKLYKRGVANKANRKSEPFFGFALCMFGLAMCFFIFCTLLSEGLLHILNPVFYAFEYIIKRLG